VKKDALHTSAVEKERGEALGGGSRDREVSVTQDEKRERRLTVTTWWAVQQQHSLRHVPQMLRRSKYGGDVESSVVRADLTAHH